MPEEKSTAKQLSAVEQAQAQWKVASAAHVESTAAVLAAEDALARLRQHIEEAKGKLTTAQSGQRSSILAGFGLGAKPSEPELSVADAQAVVDALESVVPEHEAAITAAKQQHAKTDAATRQAERGILIAKADQAEQEEAQAFADYRAKHLEHMAVGTAAGRKMYVRQDWIGRIYGTQNQMCARMDSMRAELVAQAERGE